MAPTKPKTSGMDARLEAASPSTPQRSPIRRHQGRGVTLRQKQALIDNLQLEVTERARRLRSQYNLQAQGLRSRIEIRVNRIPTALRKMKMGDLLLKYANAAQQRLPGDRGPPVPAKDILYRPSPQKFASDPARVPQTARALKRMSDEISGDKENAGIDSKKKRTRGAQAAEAGVVRTGQVLSPTSSNSRLGSRDRPVSPVKSQTARPGSPLKSGGVSRSAAATNVLSSLVEKAKATRSAGTRKVTTTSNSSSASSGTTAASKTRRAAAPKPPTSRPATRAGRRISADTETSEGTVVKKVTAGKPSSAASKKAVGAGVTRKGVTGSAQAKTAAKAAMPKAPTARGLRSKKA